MFNIFRSNKSQLRQQELTKFALEIGAVYSANDEYGQLALLKDFALFSQGHSRKITNIIVKKDVDFELNLFDYRYVISAGNSHRRIQTTVCFINSKSLELPQFFMHPENIIYKIGAWLGMQDIDFEEFPEFSDQYVLKGEFESQIRDNFDNELLHFFSINKKYYLEALNYFLIFYRKNKILSIEEVRSLYETTLFLYEKFKASDSSADM